MMLKKIRNRQEDLEESLGLELELDLFYYIENREPTKSLVQEISTALCNEIDYDQAIKLANDYDLRVWIKEAEANGFFEGIEASADVWVRKILSLAVYNYLCYIGGAYIKKYKRGDDKDER